MDPAYAAIRDGKLVNALPNKAAQGVSGDTYKFGQICDGASCVAIAPDGSKDNAMFGAGLVFPGGPGRRTSCRTTSSPIQRRISWQNFMT